LEQVLGPGVSTLTGLVDLGRGHGFGKAEIGIGDHHPAEEGDEEYAEEPSDEEEGGRFDISLERVEFQPDPGDEKSGDGENGSGGDRFADGADGPGEIFLEDRAFHQPEDGHSDDGRGISRGDGHSCPEAEVGIGRSQNDRHEQTEKKSAERELPHRGFFGNERLMTHPHSFNLGLRTPLYRQNPGFKSSRASPFSAICAGYKIVFKCLDRKEIGKYRNESRPLV
jgi:hypothetical protein